MPGKINKRSSWIRRLLIAILVLAITGASIYWYVATEKFSDTKESKAAYTVNAFDFIKEFKANEKGAKEKYDGKILIVNGKVTSVEPADTTMNIKFSDPATQDYIIFSFQPQHVSEAKSLNVGDSASIKAAFSDYLYSDILDAYSITFQRSTLNK